MAVRVCQWRHSTLKISENEIQHEEDEERRCRCASGVTALGQYSESENQYEEEEETAAQVCQQWHNT